MLIAPTHQRPGAGNPTAPRYARRADVDTLVLFCFRGEGGGCRCVQSPLGNKETPGIMVERENKPFLAPYPHCSLSLSGSPRAFTSQSWVTWAGVSVQSHLLVLHRCIPPFTGSSGIHLLRFIIVQYSILIIFSFVPKVSQVDAIYIYICL